MRSGTDRPPRRTAGRLALLVLLLFLAQPFPSRADVKASSAAPPQVEGNTASQRRPRPSVPGFQRGISLGLFAEDPAFSYQPLLDEIAAAGADHVSVVVPYYQHDIGSSEIRRHPRFSPTDAVVETVLKQARGAGLKPLLFPILRLEYPVTVEEWRGTLRPRDVEAWWRSYQAFLVKLARLASQQQAAAFCVGSELSSLDTRPERWAPLIAEVRRVYKGPLVYSANWDHYREVGIWHLVDLAGLSAYFQLTEGLSRPPIERLTHAWREQRVEISRWRARIDRPLLFTELGYHSQDRSNAFPWDESVDKPISLEEQADCYRAFVRVWDGVPYLQGVYFWNWFGWGGPHSREYAPRGKPAAQVICRWFGAGDGRCPRGHGMPWFDPKQ